MTVVLQGGAEFGADCRAMDRALLDRVDGPVVVTALAGEQGRDYATASANGVAHFRALGAQEAVAAPDVRERPQEALEVLRTAALLVLPGGSPSRLLTALRATPVGDLVRDLLDRGGSVMGASAGAMVLCAWTVLPDRRGPAGPQVAQGLGVVPGSVVLPHWSGGSSRPDWLRALDEAVPADVVALGIPEQSGVELHGGVLTAVGREGTSFVRTGEVLAVGESRPLHDA